MGHSALRIESNTDQKLNNLCERCLEALAGFDAIFAKYSTKRLDYPAAEEIDRKCNEEAGAFYDAEVAPLMTEIEKMPALTLAGFAAKARVFIADHVQIIGADEAESACAQMFEDLARAA